MDYLSFELCQSMAAVGFPKTTAISYDASGNAQFGFVNNNTDIVCPNSDEIIASLAGQFSSLTCIRNESAYRTEDNQVIYLVSCTVTGGSRATVNSQGNTMLQALAGLYFQLNPISQ